jgi:hypothetical protein
VFVGILQRQPGALVVHATGGFDWLPARPTGAKRIKNEPLRSALTFFAWRHGAEVFPAVP